MNSATNPSSYRSEQTLLFDADDTLWEKSLNAFGHELDRCETLGIPALVTHAGAHMGSGEEVGLGRIAAGLDHVLSERPGQQVTVLLETTAGQGTCLCYCFEHLAAVQSFVVEVPEKFFGQFQSLVAPASVFGCRRANWREASEVSLDRQRIVVGD